MLPAISFIITIIGLIVAIFTFAMEGENNKALRYGCASLLLLIAILFGLIGIFSLFRDPEVLRAFQTTATPQSNTNTSQDTNQSGKCPTNSQGAANLFGGNSSYWQPLPGYEANAWKYGPAPGAPIENLIIPEGMRADWWNDFEWLTEIGPSEVGYATEATIWCVAPSSIFVPPTDQPIINPAPSAFIYIQAGDADGEPYIFKQSGTYKLVYWEGYYSTGPVDQGGKLWRTIVHGYLDREIVWDTFAGIVEPVDADYYFGCRADNQPTTEQEQYQCATGASSTTVDYFNAGSTLTFIAVDAKDSYSGNSGTITIGIIPLNVAPDNCITDMRAEPRDSAPNGNEVMSYFHCPQLSSIFYDQVAPDDILEEVYLVCGSDKQPLKDEYFVEVANSGQSLTQYQSSKAIDIPSGCYIEFVIANDQAPNIGVTFGAHEP